MLVLTIDHVPGYRVEAILGEVIGATVLPDNPYVEGVKGLDGAGDARVGSVIHTREEAVADLMERATQLGANVVVGMRFDHRQIRGGFTEVCAYGTAMVVSPERALPPVTAAAPGEEEPVHAAA
jgi:uncharacterized protein YbjQ (UPF0145 family)